MVYFPPEIYTFNIGVRSDVPAGVVRGETVLYELTQFELDTKKQSDHLT